MQITRFGQSALLIKETSRGARLLIDPGTFSSDAAFQLTGLDAILITHEHPDHCDPARIGALLAANPQAPVYAPAEVLDGLSQNGLWAQQPSYRSPRVHSSTSAHCGLNR